LNFVNICDSLLATDKNRIGCVIENLDSVASDMSIQKNNRVAKGYFSNLAQ